MDIASQLEAITRGRTEPATADAAERIGCGDLRHADRRSRSLHDRSTWLLWSDGRRQREHEPPKPLLVALTLATMAGVVAVAFRVDRTYGRWLTRISPLTVPRERYEHLRDGYRVRKADATDFAELMNDLWNQIDLARSLRP